MSDIFLSYASDDRPRARAIAEAIEAEGMSVWWDRQIPAGRSFDEVIAEAIAEAKVVVVLWSERSVASDWVKEEAADGRARSVLVPVLIDDVAIPMGFKRIQCANLQHWRRNGSDAAFRRLVDDLRAVIAGGEHRLPAVAMAADTSGGSRGPARYRKLVAAGALIGIPVAVGLGWVAGLGGSSNDGQPSTPPAAQSSSASAVAPADAAGAQTLARTAEHVAYATLRADGIVEFQLEALGDRSIGHDWPDADFGSVNVDFNANGVVDRKVDRSYSTAGGEICAVYLLDGGSTMPCGELASRATYRSALRQTIDESAPHPVFTLEIPASELRDRGDEARVVLSMYSGRRGYTVFPAEARERTTSFANTLAVKLGP